MLDLLSQPPLRGATRDLCLGSGLTANRINLPYASELYPAFNISSRSPRPALCYRPLLALRPNLAIRTVTSLEPRTPHQPEKLRSCQRTILLYSFYSSGQWKIRVCKYICFQSSARRSQGCDRIWCSGGGGVFCGVVWDAVFAEICVADWFVGCGLTGVTRL